MSACATQTFSNVTPQVWACVVQQAARIGVTITGPQGQATKDGFTLVWNYDSGTQTASFQCTARPGWASCSMINGRIHDIVDGCMG